MSKDNNLHDFLQDVADAIKEKKGSNDAINAQDFSDEIKNLPSGSSPFAVDFGEEIATGNPAFINALQEDIDYYNEVQRKRAAGEVTDEELLNDWRFKNRIAWWPKGMRKPDEITGFRNLIYLELTSADTNVAKIGSYNNIDYIVVGNKNNLYGFFASENCIKKVSLSDDINRFNIIVIYFGIGSLVALNEVDYKFAPINDARAVLNNKWVQIVKGLDMTQVTGDPSGQNSINNLRYAEIKGLGVSLVLSNANLLGLESVKYILDNCQDRAGTPYTLTLHESVKTAFLAKCDEDAEYAASLASANAKGLTLA